MKRLIKILVIVAILSTIFIIPAMAEGNQPPDFNSSQGMDVSDQYILILKGKHKLSDLENKVEELGGSVIYYHPTGFAVVSDFTKESAAELGLEQYILDIIQDGTYQLNPLFDANLASAVEDFPESPSDPTTAARYSWQWNMRAIEADKAWTEGELGSSDVTVAILDTGIDYTYPDLSGRVDLSRSISFIPEDDYYVSYYFPGKHPITDIHYHGTHVAATVASNALIAAGVTSQTTLIGVKVCSAVLGYCPDSAIVMGILHAVDNDADIINMSLGGYFDRSEEKGLVGTINKLFNYAHSKGVTIVVSAGNAAEDLDHDGNSYKTYCNTPNVICVSATGPSSAFDFYEGPWYGIDDPAFYTNYGRSAINVAAPGGNSGGYVWAGCSQTSLVIPVCQTGIYIVGLAGTSMSAPHVSGLAALLVEDIGRNPGQIKNLIQQSADDLGQPGTDPFYGKGRINVYEAVK